MITSEQLNVEKFKTVLRVVVAAYLLNSNNKHQKYNLKLQSEKKGKGNHTSSNGKNVEKEIL